MDTEKTRRQNKVEELLRQITASFISEENDSKILITVTRVSVSKDLKRATVYITALPERRQDQALSLIKRKAGDLRQVAKKKLSTRTLPYFDFEIDLGELHRQRLDEVSREIKEIKARRII